MGIPLVVGTRYRSAVCNTEVIIIKAPAHPVDLRCGGRPVLAIGTQPDPAAHPLPDYDRGSELGKRYVADNDLELLCSKAGPGTLSVGEHPLTLKAPKPLPSSD